MFKVEDILDISPFSLGKKEKQLLFTKALSDLLEFHHNNCEEFKRILDLITVNRNVSSIEDYPFIPVRLFKDYSLLSVDKSQVVKTMTSSGTTGRSVSRIFLDKTTSINQSKALIKIASNFIGKNRLPLLVMDSKSVLKNRELFSARGAGILGFSMLGHDITYALDENMNLDLDIVQTFLSKHKGEPFLMFGFTFIIWQHFYKYLMENQVRIKMDNGILIHGGGWKKLIDVAIDNDTFKRLICEASGIKRIYNYYGMVEQTGSIFMECEFGHLHSSIYSDILIRDYRDFSSLGMGEEGLIQLVSLLPKSYPGNSILTEDWGRLLGEDDCPCGRLGKYFEVQGRIKNAEIRGCSDTYAYTNS